MDKNTIIGLLLIFILFIVFSLIYKPQPIQQIKEYKDTQPSNDNVTAQLLKNDFKHNQNTLVITNQNVDTNTIMQSLKERYGLLYKFVKGKEKLFSLENKELRVEFTNKGAFPKRIYLKNFRDYKGDTIVFWNSDSIIFSLNFFVENKHISTSNLYFSLVMYDTVNKVLIFRLNADTSNYLDFEYKLPEDSFKLYFTIRTNNFNEFLKNRLDYFTFNITSFASRFEKNFDYEKNNSTIYYKYEQEEVDHLSYSKDDKKEILSKISWISFKQHFFNFTLYAPKSFNSAVLEVKNSRSEEGFLKKFYAEMTLDFGYSKNYEQNFVLYFGPNHYRTLKNQNIPDLQEIIPLGWALFRWVNKYFVIPIFNFLGKYISNYGIIILIMTIIIKVVLFPLTYKSYLAMAKIKVLQPQIQELQKKIPKDKPLELQRAMMNLYRNAGVNPMGGCLPTLLQLPLLIALFQFFPNSFELRHKPFLWAKDLSTYDSIINFGFNIPLLGDHLSLFCILMTLSSILYSHIQNKMNPSSTSMPNYKFMSYLFPIMLLFIFNNSSAGLSYYYLLFNLFSFGQTYFFSLFIKEEEILKQIEKNKKKGSKKSKWQERIEKYLKEQQKKHKYYNKK